MIISGHMKNKISPAIPLIVATTLLVVLSIVIVVESLEQNAAAASTKEEPQKLAQARARAFGPQGIVVPKRSSIISGLNQQFKLKSKTGHYQQQQQQQQAQQQQLQLPAQLPLLNVTISLQHGTLVEEPQLNGNSNKVGPSQTTTTTTTTASQQAVGLFPINWLGPLSPITKKQQQLKEKENNQQQQQILQQTHQNLYLDRYQQQLLAANPSLLNPPAGTNLSTLLTRSDVNNLAGLNLDPSVNSHQHLANHGFSFQGLNVSRYQQQQQEANGNLNNNNNNNNNNQLYRGFSLIELEVKSEADRRYVQDLYGNLSAAINEQAQNPNSVTVSPYVDVDFWSFKYALNDRIDIMVSPKSRAFILGQLNRNKIRHRIKIEDIQARLDQQQPQQQQQPQLAPNAAAGSGLSAQPAATGHPSGYAQHQHHHHHQMGGPMGKSADTPLSGRQVGGDTVAASERQAPPDSPTSGRLAPPEVGGGGGGGAVGLQQSAGPLNDSMFFENYQRLNDITQYIESIVERNRDVARVKVIGRSSQGRYLRVLRLGYESDGSSSLDSSMDYSGGAWRSDTGEAGRQPATIDNAQHILDNFFKRQAATKKLGSIWLDGGTHAREWISPATALYIAHRLSDNHNKCLGFFESMRQIVATSAAVLLEKQQLQQQQQANNNARQARRFVEPHPAVLPAPIPPPTHLDPSLIPGINEINTSLLGKPVEPKRPRTELEKTMELLAKSPQVLASEHRCDLDLDQLLRRYTFYVMPVLNPDGYEYSHTHNRLWRKTRSTSSHPIYRHFCLGADPNRNYDARHGSTGSSSHPCSQTYAGTVPFTEPETRHQSNFVYANRLSMKMFISFHSYSQMILLPFSHSKMLAPDHKDLESVGQAAVKAIERTHGTVYRVGPSASILYTASGTASDWAYEKAGVKYSYTIELRDTGAYGFLLPKQQIVPTGEETFNGLLAMIQQMEKNDNLLTSKSDAANKLSPSGHPTNNSSSTITDYNHAPDPDQLTGQFGGPGHIGPIRPPLENILDGSNTWAASDSGPSGVRDRRPIGHGFVSEKSESAISKLAELEPNAGPVVGDEHMGSDTEPDSGYAFEGEGELMEPTRENVVEATRLSNDLRVTGRRDHSRRISQATGLTSSGRNYINSPLLTSRQTTSAPRRESSDDLAGSPGLH